MVSVEQLIERLDGVTDAPGSSPGIRWTHTALCPVHDDSRPSCRVGVTPDGFLRAMCFACSAKTRDVLAAVGLLSGGAGMDKPFTVIRPKKKPATRRRRVLIPTDQAPATLALLSEKKAIPAYALRAWHVDDSRYPFQRVRMRYFDYDGTPGRCRFRNYMQDGSRPRFVWDKGDLPLIPYGLWRLHPDRADKVLHITEGESDAWALWMLDPPIQAIGIPGASMTGRLRKQDVEGWAGLKVFCDGDEAGESFVLRVFKRVRSFGLNMPIDQVNLSKTLGVKDPSDLWVQQQEAGHAV